MNQRSIIAAVAASVALAAPLGAAAPWMSYGDYEPNTVLDDPGLNWASPPPAGELRIYFNAYSTATDGVVMGSGYNPNVAAARTHVEPVGNEQQWALLGVWTDCNGDGYVGHAESAFREYPSALLLDDERCAPQQTASGTCWHSRSGSPPPPCAPWPATWNNVNGWVQELIPIGNGEATSGDMRVIKDVRAAVWGDYGKPNVITSDAGTCAISPWPRGTAQSTGGILTYVDCGNGLLEAWNTPWQDEHRVLGETVPGAGDVAGLRFDDPNDGTSNELGQQPTFGDESSENAIVHAGDCSDPDNYLLRFDELPVAPPAVAAWGEGIRSPDTTYLNPNGNVAGTVNYTMESGFVAQEQTDDEDGASSTPNCDFHDDRGSDLYGLVEGDFTSVSAADKREADWNFAFTTMTRGGVPLGVIGTATPASNDGGAAGGAPSDAGLEPFNNACGIGCQQSEWFGGSTNAGKLPQTFATRGTLAEGDIQVIIDEAYWLTFYAYVDTAKSIAATPGGQGFYTPCGDQDTGLLNGWNCDAGLWNLNPDGTRPTDPYQTLAFPNKLYDFLDVDCYDGSVTPVEGTTVPLLPAGLGDRPCAIG